MKTPRRIMTVLGAVAAATVAVAALLCRLLGLAAGAAAVGAIGGTLVAAYHWVVRPWHEAWGATDEEAAADMPGDALVAGGATTRAITIHAAPGEVWPWLVQIGYGRAGWYSYDWLDNDGQPSATTIIDEFQQLSPGTRISMTPDIGFVVRSFDRPHHIVAQADDGSTSWCLQLTATDDGSTRLVSRFRTPDASGIASLLMHAVVGPGSFIMERRMLEGIRARAEHLRRTAPSHG